MVCPFCGSKQTEIYNSRKTHNGKRVWRRRRCLSCSEAYTTYESIDLGFLNIKKKSGAWEPYIRPKLFMSIYASCAGLPKQAQTVDALADTVESKLLDLKDSRIESKQIAHITLNTLANFHQGAYLRYLSYRPDMAE